MSSRREIERAAALYEGFREERPRRARIVRTRFPKGLAEIGVVEFIGYRTTHGGKLRLYIHEFAPGSRPRMYAGTARGELFFFGGRFRVTDRGITDIDRTGRPVHAVSRYVVKQRT